jgi:hypothetical protein
MMSEARTRELVAFALRELPSMQQPDGWFCTEVRTPDLRPEGRSIRYSVMVALGLLRARAAGQELSVDVDALCGRLAASDTDPAVTAGDLGLLIWLDRRGGGQQAERLAAALEARLAQVPLAELQGMEVAWIAIGAHACVQDGLDGAAVRLLAGARAQLCGANRAPSGLLRHRGTGVRRRFPNFATQIYGILALSHLGRAGDSEALDIARGVADAVVSLQRSDGGWPWIFDAERGRVVEPYEVYSVHQDAMAPMGLLELYEATGEERYRQAASRGLPWIFGQNELGRPLFDRDRRIIYRSIRRREPWDRLLLGVNVASSTVGLPLAARWRGPLEVNPTDRPYHLGWVLEGWCGRENLASV